MRPPYKALTIAKWFVAWAAAEEADLTNLKLQKLLYYAQGWHLVRHGFQLFTDPLEAWSHGPVVPEVYRVYKAYGSNDLSVADDDSFAWDEVDEETTQFLIKVWNTYGQYAAWRLRAMTHDERPWQEHFRPDERHIVIPETGLRDFFAAQDPRNVA